MTSTLLVVLLLLVAFFQMLGNMALELRFKSVTFLIWPVLGLFVALPIFVHLLVEQRGAIDTLALSHALSIAIIFNFFYASGFLVSAVLAGERGLPGVVTDFQRRVFFVLPYCMAAIVILILAAQGFNLARIVESTWKDKQDLGFFAVVIIWLVCALGGLFCYAIEERKLKVLLVIVLTVSLVVVLYRTRAIISVLLVSCLVYLIVIKNRSLRLIFWIGVVGIVLAIGVRALRFLGVLSNAADFVQLTDVLVDILKSTFSSGDLSIYRVYLRIINDCHVHLDCFNFTIIDSIFSILGVVEKSALGIEYDLYSQMVESGVGGSLHPTIYGLIYADMGLFAGMVFFFMVGVFNFSVSAYSKGWRFYSMIGFIAPYIIFFPRGSFYNSVSLIVVGVLYTAAIGFFFNGKRRFLN